MTLQPHFPPRLQTRISLPASKSLSNRALLLGALSGNGSSVTNASDCDDTRVMQRALTLRPEVVDVMAAGTAMRFLTAYFSICPGETHVLTGTERMRERPIGVLVDALRTLGADIAYCENEGFPPLRVVGKTLKGGCITLPADVSSQYISALLMVAPMMREGLTLMLEGEIISRPYIDMTLALMRHFGASAEWSGTHALQVAPGAYRANTKFAVESDWSAASYWYEMVSLSTDPEARVELTGLSADSLQGDSAVQHFFEPLGVRTEFAANPDRAILTKNEEARLPSTETLTLNLNRQPDVAQTLVVCCAMQRIPFRFSGLQSLRIKETDRMAALANELKHFGITLGIDNDTLYIDAYAEGTPAWNGTPIATYHDHRMAMAFAPAGMVCKGVSISHPEVVTKSYPAFWQDLETI